MLTAQSALNRFAPRRLTKIVHCQFLLRQMTNAMYNYFIVSYFENRTMSRLIAQPVIELPNRNLERFALSSDCTA